MKMADGIKLCAESESSDLGNEEEKVAQHPYNHQLTPYVETEQAPEVVEVEHQNVVNTEDVFLPRLEDPISDYVYDRVRNPSSIMKRTRGRPRKDCQRPGKHHLGQSGATKVFPGRPRFRGRKHLQHYFLTHPNHKIPDIQSALDVYEDIDSDLKTACNISSKMLISAEAVPDNELRIEKFCALCNLSEKSLLGQGKMKFFKASESFDCFKEMERKRDAQVTATAETGSELKLFFKKQKLTIRQGSKPLSEKVSLFTDLIQELEVTGFKCLPDAPDIFQQSGELYAHFNCAAWSDGVTKTFEKLLSNVDKAVVAAAFQKCSKCNRYGASVRCCVSECTKIYHYPCAIVSGALQNANCFKIICSIHLEDAFSFGVICMACHESGDLSRLLLCTSCSNYYHGSCMDPPITPSPDVRAGWQCLDCKVCQNCRQPDDGSKMIICNTCDKGYHCFCIKPAVSSVPKSGWKCSACRMCGDCGARTPGSGPSSRWHLNYSVCDSCYQQRNKGIACPLCGKAYRQFSQRKAMRHCVLCQKYIHEECDKRGRRNSMDYVCPLCSAAEVKSVEGGDFQVKDNFQSSSRDSFLSGNEESLSTDSEDNYDGVHSKIVGRRTSSGELRQKKPKRKYKAFSIPNFLFSMSSLVSQKEYKMDDDDPTEDNKLILASATDEFVLCQDLCVMCGSFGRGEEGRLLACAQCGQCYHSYCVSVKVTTVVLRKGWRCLDCTVCEGCGQPHDEGRLLLCDECDISFHIYCLDPPLQEVPQGNWKCKWCVNCIKCGSKSPGLNCSWQVNYTLCGPCASLAVCILCHHPYQENDLLVQCTKCERWLHGLCDQVENEDQAERCAEYGYNCPHCRLPDELPPHMLPPPRTPTPEIEVIPEKHPSPVSRPKDPDPPVVKSKQPVQFYLDGVCLSESGMQYIKSLAPEQPKKIPRPRKLKLEGSKPFSLFSIDRNEDSVPAPPPPTEEVKCEPMSAEELAMKAYDFEEGKATSDTPLDDKKKRPRKLQKLGIGGFSVKPRGRCTSGKEAVGEGEGSEGLVPPPTQQEGMTDLSEMDKPKRKRKPKRKTHLDESFPTYLRDAFFGKELLVSCKKLGKSSDGPEDAIKEGGPKVDLESSNVKAQLQEDVKDFMPLSGAVKNRDLNMKYKSLIKSEIESIKEEHLSSASSLEGTGFPVSKYPLSGNHPSVIQNHPDSNSSWGDSDCDQTQMQKSLLKWESDEQLGLLSTISPVLYANINLPHLKIEFPAWGDRVKQIAKIWRGLPTEKRQPYLQRARENRAASRSTQRSSSVDSDKSQKDSGRLENEQEKQWKQLQAMRQMQQQRLLQEQRQAALRSQVEKASAASEVDRNLKLYHSKSLSEIPQQFVVAGKEGRKVFEKRWSSSSIDLNAAQMIMQNTKIKMEMPNPVQPSFLKECIQNPVISSPSAQVIHAPRMQTPVEPLHMSDSPRKTMDSSPLGQLQKNPLAGKDERSQEILSTPPATPRPHSSDSFFQVSASPQSHLLASLDTHSQPTPPSNKGLGGTTVAAPKSAIIAESPKGVIPPPSKQPSVEQFVLQQSPLTPANLVKQLSQYKETFGSIQEKSMEQFLQDDLPHQQHLRDLLQKKDQQPSSTVSEVSANTKPDVDNSVHASTSSLPDNQKTPDASQQDPQSEDFLPGENEKKNNSPNDVCLAPKDELKEEELNKKRKTTAADLMKDLESHPEEHDVISSGCNLDVLPGDVGELELDDDELLGLGNDFNILEYADPELDKSLVGEGDKNNILDEHLDLDDKDEELEDDVIKESAQEKDLISQELSPNKRSTDEEKCKVLADTDKNARLSDTFLNFDKKDSNVFENSFETKSLETCSENPPVEPIPTSIKEEAKQVFSSCTLSSHTYTPGIDVKLEKTENCSVPKPHPLSFGSESIPPPSYRMVTTLKQAPHPQQNKGIFPLHLNMSTTQQGVMSSSLVEPNKPLLLQEQPLLLAELVEQEKREQRRHTQEGMISPQGDALLSDIDFERLKDDVFSGPPDDSLGGPGSLLGSHEAGLQTDVSSSPNSHNFGPPPYSLLWQNQDSSRNVAPRAVAGFIPNLKKASVSAVISSLGLQTMNQKTQALSGSVAPRPFNPQFVATPPSPPTDPHMDPEKLKLLNYEKQLLQQQAVLSTQQKYFETEVIRLRKMKKALNAKQRQLRKNGSELTENDSLELARVSQEQAGLQKQLDQVRKQTRQTTIALQDHRLKQQKRQQPPQPLPLHPSVNSVQSSPQNSPLHFTHPPSPLLPTSPSASLRLHSPSPLMQSSTLFSSQLPLQLQMAKAEAKNWPTTIKVSQGEVAVKRDPPDRSVSLQAFPMTSTTHSPQSDAVLKGLTDAKKDSPKENLADAEQQSAKPASENVSPAVSEQKEDPISTVQSPVPPSILSQSLPSSVSNTLKFTLRQTGMPTVCLPTETAGDQIGYAAEKTNESKPIPKMEEVKGEALPPEQRPLEELTVIKKETSNNDEEKTEMGVTSHENNQVAEVKEEKEEGVVHIKQEVIEEEEPAPKRKENEGSSDEELENLTKPSSEAEQGEQNVLLKQLLQNCPSADTPRKLDSLLGLNKDGEEANKLELSFDVADLQGKPKAKKPSYLDIRRAQLEKEPTPPPGEKPKPIKRKRPKKKKLEQPDKVEGLLAKKKCRRASSKAEEGYETYVETLMNKLTSLPPLRILEPNIRANFSAIPAFGAGDLNLKECQLKECYGSATIPDHNDVYSFHPFTKEQAPPAPLLPPSSPPYRGFYNQEFPAIAKAFERNEMSLALKSPMDIDASTVSREAGSPASVISSSSPECCVFEPQSKFPKLVFVDRILPESPVIPLMYPIPLRLFPREISQLNEDKDKENIPYDKTEIGLTKTKMSGIGGYSAPLKDSGNVAVTLTLSSAAAEDICGVLSALAELLKIPIPASYEIVERTATPPSQKLGLYRRSKNSDVSIHSLMNGKPRFCRHCDIVVLSAGIRKKVADLTYISKEEQEDEEEEVIFCSTNCYMQFALTHQSTAMLTEEKEAATIVDHIGEIPYEKSVDDLVEENLYDVDKMEICDEEPLLRKWKCIKYKYWHPDDAVAKARRKDDNEKSARPFYHTIKPTQMPRDERKCIFCHITGDGDTNGAARLLNMDVNKWVHLNCALWSYEVYETVNGALMNVEVAFKRSRHLTCYSCHKQGASVRCFKTRCPNVYHFPCARKEQCAFYKDKTVLCPQHIHKGNPENRLDSVAVFRRVYINREEHKQVASMIQDDKYVMRVGSLIFLNIGQLLPTQIQAFHTPNCIYPVGYKVIRMYWSMRKLGRRSQYICNINEVSGKPEFSIQVKDSDNSLVLRDKTAKGVWQKVLFPIEKMRKQAKTIKIFPDFITGDDLFGLTEPAVLRIVESLPGVDTLFDYSFRYGRSPFLELPLAINPTGCARSEPKLRTHFKRSQTLHTSNATRQLYLSAFAGLYPEVSSSPYIKQFVHSKSSQYRKMKTEWRNNVYLARSRIQGLGLYAAKDLEKHTMVIEYIGQLIRNEIAERNEAIYNSQNRGTYMFRLDENRVIDATLSGGLARYINHSCYPNCVAEAVQIDRENKIIIITNRRVSRGEELAYDYKFEVEDDQHKIPCLCGAPNCRKWMN